MPRSKDTIVIHSAREFEGMRAAGRLAAETLDFITPHVKAGTHTDYLNRLCHEFITERGGICAPLNYNGFPKSICTSINEVVCHGIPKKTDILRDGDIINIDVTPTLDGWHGDTSRMFLVGEPNDEAKRLVETTYEAMMLGIEVVRPGATLGDIGHAIQSCAEAKGYSIVEDFCGHGLGRSFHTAPQILHYGKPGKGDVLRAGMFFTVEPMINIGKKRTRVLDDDWTAVTLDGSLSAQFEHSLAVTEDGYEIFTSSPLGWTAPPYVVP
ncbi:MAG: type I methionyl aminopeptidase [Planctomycetota bacterium]